MKEIKAKDLKVGDVFYYNDRYQVVVARILIGTSVSIKAKIIVGPTNGIGKRDWYYIANYVKVLLLCRDGKEV